MATRVCVQAALVAAIAGSASAQLSQSVSVKTDTSGAYWQRSLLRHGRPWGGGGADSTLWTDPESVSIPTSCALAPVSGSAWVGEELNNERLQRFLISGSGVPAFEVPGHHVTFNPAATAAAGGSGDLAVFLDQLSQNGVLVLTAYHAGSATPAWTYSPSESFVLADVHNVKVSRDGSTVALVVADNPQGDPPPLQTTLAVFLNGADGSVRATWSDPTGGSNGVDLTDNGSTAIICQGAPPAGFGRLIDTATGSLIQSFSGSGAGGRYNISGDGRVLVIGGFYFQVFVKVGGSYTPRISFNAPSSWFSWASAVSRDGSTVGGLAHDYGSGYLNTTTRIWDVESGQLLGSYPTIGSGTLQDSAVGAAMADDGSRLAVASWGDAGNSHPQVMVFDRGVNLIGSLTTPGSPFAIDMSGDGQYVLTGYKSIHANQMGNGGGATLIQLPVAPACYPNCDASTAPPVLNIGDFTCFLQKFAAGCR